jgi:hypothetical protein
MKDKPPLIMTRVLGSLRPLNPSAAKAIEALTPGARIEVRIVKGSANLRRLGFYWVMLDVAADALSDGLPEPIDAERLHRILKEKLELYTPVPLPSGDVFKDYESISVAAMSEPDRARWVDRVSAVLSKWLQVPIVDLMNEARAREAA